MMKKYRAIQKIVKGDKTIMPGLFIDEDFSKKEIEQLIADGFAAEKIYPKKKKVKDGNGKNS
jgi:hypothetical protein